MDHSFRCTTNFSFSSLWRHNFHEIVVKITNGPKSVGKVCAHHFVVRRPIDKEFKKIPLQYFRARNVDVQLYINLYRTSLNSAIILQQLSNFASVVKNSWE